MLNKDDLNRRRGAKPGPLHDPVFQKKYPTLYDYLTQTSWPDGTPRELASLSIYPSPGILRIFLRDPATGLCCWVSCTSLTEVYEAVEAALNDSGHEWRVDRREQGEVAKRKHQKNPLANGQK